MSDNRFATIFANFKEVQAKVKADTPAPAGWTYMRRNNIRTHCLYRIEGWAEQHGFAGPCNCGGSATRDHISLL